MSPISSRKIVPPSASSNFPSRALEAPVKAPFSCPNSSLSISSLGMAAQLTATKGLSRRGERAWMALAASSLPVPVSPSIRTVISDGADLPDDAEDLGHLVRGPDQLELRLQGLDEAEILLEDLAVETGVPQGQPGQVAEGDQKDQVVLVEPARGSPVVEIDRPPGPRP